MNLGPKTPNSDAVPDELSSSHRSVPVPRVDGKDHVVEWQRPLVIGSGEQREELSLHACCGCH